MSAALLIDFDVLAAYLAGEAAAADFLEFAGEDLLVSAVTVAQLLSGARDAGEHDAITTSLSAFTFHAVDAAVANEAAALIHAHPQLALTDALVAATARVRQARLVTLDRRRYPAVIEVHVPWRRML